MDPKSKEIYEKIEHFLEERKGRDRRDHERPEQADRPDAAGDERRKRQDRRSSTNG